MTKDNFSLFFWGVTIILLTFMVSLWEDNFSHSFALAIALLPAIFAMKYSLKNISFADKAVGTRNLIFAGTASLLLGELMVVIMYYNFGFFSQEDTEKPLADPLMIVLFVTLPAIIAWQVERLIEKRLPYNNKITFVSDRRNITLDPATILLIESNDTEVYLHTADGESYRTRTRISHWEALLDDRFVRVHRSYIINISHIKNFDSQRIIISDRTIEISRKYRDEVRAALDRRLENAKERI